MSDTLAERLAQLEAHVTSMTAHLDECMKRLRTLEKTVRVKHKIDGEDGQEVMKHISEFVFPHDHKGVHIRSNFYLKEQSDPDDDTDVDHHSDGDQLGAGVGRLSPRAGVAQNSRRTSHGEPVWARAGLNGASSQGKSSQSCVRWQCSN